MVVIGLVDHVWAAQLQRAVSDNPVPGDPSVDQVLAEHGFQNSPALEDALRHIDFEKIRAVAQAFDPDLDPEVIC
jgi:hypothetical protein